MTIDVASPPDSTTWTPVYIGPTWQRNEDGAWKLPERTLGWHALGWCAQWLQHRPGVPWRFTNEQARFILWWYALNPDGTWVYRDGVLQRLKGWGKDPVEACIAAFEAFGPCRFGGWASDGEPIAVEHPHAWVQLAAVSLEQTKNTMRLFPGLFTKEARREFGLKIGKEKIFGLNGTRVIEAVTSSPASLEGGRPTHTALSETHHWDSSNEGHAMADVIERNSTKAEGGTARTLRYTNAYEPGQDSVAERDRELWNKIASGEVPDPGFLYDSVEAPPEAPLSVEDAPAVLRGVRGDSVWLDIPNIVKSIADIRNPASRSRRFWYNQIVAAEDAWCDPLLFGMAAAERKDPPVEPLLPGEQIVLFFDGSKSDDSTGIVACRVSDGHIATLGVWQKPPGERGKGWIVPREAVDQTVEDIMQTYDVQAFFADPSDVRDDEDGQRFWEPLIDKWHRRYAQQLRLWSNKTGDRQHSISWDMRSQRNQQEFTLAAMRFINDVETFSVTHDNHPALVQHVRNARRAPNKFGVSMQKEHRESSRKIDLAVCAVGARMVWRLLLNKDAAEKPRGGRLW